MSETETAAHYEKLLALHYTWMLGSDFDELVAQQRYLLASCGVGSPTPQAGVALDLGCGSGVHSVALAQLGYDTVVAVDISQTLLTELTARSTAIPAIRPVHADLSAGLEGIVEPQSVTTAACMGDTLPHLPDTGAVRRLIHDTFEALAPGGAFVLSFRDLTTPLSGLDRFIQVRSDADRIMTCFLEDDGDAVRVHDLIHTRNPDGDWQLSKSSYRKLRLAPDWVAEQISRAGFTAVTVELGPGGLCVITARRPDNAVA